MAKRTKKRSAEEVLEALKIDDPENDEAEEHPDIR